MHKCQHTVVDCINPFEIIRKYRCRQCGGVAICACDEEYGRQFLPHQMSTGTDLESQQRVSVTLGIVERMCNDCRGLKSESHPRAALHGATSKLRRYYWREIHMETTRRIAAWEASREATSDSKENRAERDRIEGEVVAELQERHHLVPKYDYKEPSEADVLRDNEVEIVSLRGLQLKTDAKRALLDYNGDAVTVEEFATRYLYSEGYQVTFAESAPFHVLYGVFMWMVIQDQADPLVRLVSFGSRTDFEAGKTQPELIVTHLPADFGAPGYRTRRVAAIDRHFREMLEDVGDLTWLFDYWIGPSTDFRQYLWAHRESDIARARQILQVLPQAVLLRILRYLADGYWQRYLGWPDLLAVGESGFFFAEVKFSKDKLSEDQRRWVVDNRSFLHLPFKLIKIHRSEPAT